MVRIVTSVVILVVHQNGIAVFKSKSQSPIAIEASNHVSTVACGATRCKLCSADLVELHAKGDDAQQAVNALIAVLQKNSP